MWDVRSVVSFLLLIQLQSSLDLYIICLDVLPYPNCKNSTLSLPVGINSLHKLISFFNCHSARHFSPRISYITALRLSHSRFQFRGAVAYGLSCHLPSLPSPTPLTNTLSFSNTKTLEQSIQHILRPDLACYASDGLGGVSEFFCR
jgi:hypothetical protein